MSTDEPTIDEQLEDALESAKCWRQAHDEQLDRAIIERAKTRAAERKARLLQSKLDGTAMANDTVMGELVKDALDLLGEWATAARLSHSENTFEIQWRVGKDLNHRTHVLLSTPRIPK